ncbi:BCS1 N terminal-domain-containing protein [Calycina marina]|uniref:BCS1 N terminal-domain-containing protein n=1 Tax=Calycina marina TaxID=1763456 RepID=A0A9P7YVS7_9HELO|nr:BCS1 N terminal-domain-containing protein [Calycina marina]
MSTSPSPAPPASWLPLDLLFDNPVFAGGAGLAGLGAAAAISRKLVGTGVSTLKRRLLLNVEISKKDDSYEWILKWIALPRPQTGFITSRLTRVNQMSMKTARLQSKTGQGQYNFFLQTGYGKHILRHKNAFISVNREKQSSYNMQTGEPHETITLTTLYAHRHIFEDIFGEAYALARVAQEGKTIMHTTNGTNWQVIGEPRKKRPLNSVILDAGVKEKIADDVKDFLAMQEWYVDRGIPYRRGYLLHGPPGSGKSSFINALAGELDFGVSIINLSERGLTDDRLAQLLQKVPARTLLLLEDADAAFVNRRKMDPDGYNGANVTFSGLLNALDGVAAGEERIAFLTTNHIERLDEALIRPGRVDMTVRIGHATKYQAAEMWDRFYGDIDEDGKGRERFLSRLEALGLFGDQLPTSTAAIQGLFLFNKGDMNGAIDMAEGLIPKIYEAEVAVGVKTPA